MNLLHGPAIADLCDYDFGDQAGCLGGVSGAFMKDANESNLDLSVRVSIGVPTLVAVACMIKLLVI